MTTPPPDKQPAAEMLDQISRRLVIESGLKLYGKRRQSLEDLIFHASSGVPIRAEGSNSNDTRTETS